MPFIPNEKFKIGDWVYLRLPVYVQEGLFTPGTRVFLVSMDDCGLFEFRDEQGNKATEVSWNHFTKELQ